MGSSGEERATGEPGAAPEGPFELDVTDVNASGEGVGRIDGLVVFVPRATAGDRVVATITRAARRHATARLERVLEPSPDRVEAPCPHQAACGGCPLMTLDPAASLALRTRRLEEVLTRIGDVDLVAETVVASPRTVHYRGRVRFAIAGRGRGARPAYRAPGDARRLVPVDACLIGPPDAVPIARALLATGSLPHDVREIEVRHSFATGQHLVVLHAMRAIELSRLREAAKALIEEHEGVAGVALVTRGARTPRHLSGARTLRERIGPVEIDLGPTGFLQVNPAAAELLYAYVNERLGVGKGDRLLDLYAGAGLIGLHAVRSGATVLGIEADVAAAMAGRSAARGLAKGVFQIEPNSCEAALDELIGRGARFEAVAANPPRRGLGPGVAEKIAQLEPACVVLVSCHPAALARDVRRLVELGWSASGLAAVDMFPHTAHLEAVVSLERGEAV